MKHETQVCVYTKSFISYMIEIPWAGRNPVKTPALMSTLISAHSLFLALTFSCTDPKLKLSLHLLLCNETISIHSPRHKGLGVNNPSRKHNVNQILNHPKQCRADTKYKDDCMVHMNSSPAGSRCH